MITGIGVDMESVKRLKKASQNKEFLDLVFTQREIRYCKKKKKPHISFAGKFCAKEAVIKAYNKKISFKNIEIINLRTGKIGIFINGKRNNNIHCSISHTEEYAVAVAVLEK